MNNLTAVIALILYAGGCYLCYNRALWKGRKQGFHRGMLEGIQLGGQIFGKFLETKGVKIPDDGKMGGMVKIDNGNIEILPMSQESVEETVKELEANDKHS